MDSIDYTLGERVLATVGGAGLARTGVVTAVLNADRSSYGWGGAVRYMVKFDGDLGHSGPCIVFRAEHGREAASPASGTAA